MIAKLWMKLVEECKFKHLKIMKYKRKKKFKNFNKRNKKNLKLVIPNQSSSKNLNKSKMKQKLLKKYKS